MQFRFHSPRSPSNERLSLLMALTFLGTLSACGTSTIHVAPDSSRRGGQDSYAAPEGGEKSAGTRTRVDDEPAEAPNFPKCPAEESAKATFPERTNGSDYRAIVRLTISPDGKPQDPCLLLTEGPEDLAGKALQGIREKSYNPEHAGQKRDVVVTYKYR